MVSVSLSLAAAVLLGAADALKPNPKYPQLMKDRYSPLKLMANYAPYNTRSGWGISDDTPAGCKVDQVVVLGRHAERYPDPDNVDGQLAALQKIRNDHPEPFMEGDLAFFDDWKYFVDGHMGDISLLTRYGVYAGTADAFDFGSKIRGSYGHLWTLDPKDPLPIFSANNERVLNTARSFGEGYFGYNYSDCAAVNLLEDSGKVGGNSLGTSFCNATFHTPSVNYTDFPELHRAASRLNTAYGLTLNATDIFNLLDMSTHDFMLKGGASPWWNIFTAEEWVTYQYIRSAILFNQNGPGSTFSLAVGANFMNATTTLFNNGPIKDLAISLNFGYDTTITAVLAGAGILIPAKNLSASEVTFNTGYDASDIAPMGARTVFERMTCDCSQYVRVKVNDAVVPLDYDHSGPGFSTPLDSFTKYNLERRQKYNYTTICKPVQNNVPIEPSFWWNYYTSTAMNYPISYITFQGDVDT